MRPNPHRLERASSADLAQCRAAIRVGSHSFYLASLLLPDRIRGAAYALYAFCRLSDDAVDEAGGGLTSVTRLSERLDAIYTGRPVDAAVDRALADTVEVYAIPRACFDALLEGLEWDARGRRYDTLEDVIAYAARVAASVGAMMAALMGAREMAVVARACDLGVAMQLTNIARDVGEDARAGRLYLPLNWFAEAGLDAETWLARPGFSPALGEVVARLLAEADKLYQRADAGIVALDGDVRKAIRAARLLYAEIGAEVARNGFDSVSQRAVVPKRKKLALALAALSPRAVHAHDLAAPPLPQTRFLVDALSQAPAREAAEDGGLGWSLALMAALEARPRRVI
jgi:phytoene synthase